MQFEWAEDDFDLPRGVDKLNLPEPVSGKKYIMYHGTTRAAAQAIQRFGFRQSADGMLGRGVYLSRDLNKASRYPIRHPESDRVVIRVVVNVGKVKTIDRQNHPLRRTWHDHGYDTAWVPPNCGMVKSGLEEDCVWDSKQIQIDAIINPKPIQRPVQRPVQHSACGGYSGYGGSGAFGGFCRCSGYSGYGGSGAFGGYNPWNNFGPPQSYRWDEDAFTVPDGVYRLNSPQPTLQAESTPPATKPKRGKKASSTKEKVQGKKSGRTTKKEAASDDPPVRTLTWDLMDLLLD